MQLIAFTGLRGSGKDTAAQVAIELGYEHVKMAGALKAMLRSMLAYQGVPRELAEEYIEGDRKEVATAWLGGKSMRHAMKTLGTEWGREMLDQDIWVNVTRERCLMFDKVVISDIRFPNEAAMVASLGGRMVRINRGLPATDLHESERHIPTLPVDFELENKDATAAMFRKRVWYTLFTDHPGA